MTTFHDRNGFPIHPGDLLKSPHFIGARRKRYYLYHVAVLRDGRLWMVPTSHLEPSKVKDGGSCLLSEDTAAACEIIDGHGPGNILSFEDRPRARREANR